MTQLLTSSSTSETSYNSKSSSIPEDKLDSGESGVGFGAKYKPIAQISTNETVEQNFDAELTAVNKIEPKYRQFSYEVINALAELAVEDGEEHPAEKIIEQALLSDRVSNSAIISTIIEDTFRKLLRTRPSLAAGLLRCVGRLDKNLVGVWAYSLCIVGLTNSNLQVRESAVRALENWGGLDSKFLLTTFATDEKVAWLRDYIEEVIEDL